VTGTPKTVGAYTELTRKLLLQSSLDVELMVRNDLAAVLARAIDLAAIHGTGANGQPTGVTVADDVAEVTLASAGSPTYADLVNFEAAIESDNADIGAMRWIGGARVKGKLRAAARTVDNSGNAVGERRLYEDGQVLEYPFQLSNQVSTGTLLFGVWSELVIGMWGGLDLNTDTSNLVTSGGVQVVALQDVDVMLRHPEAFAFAENVYVPAS
jgi:HK97 family phage major capsid protein